MLRRLLPTISGLALGFAVLLAGLLSLERVFRQERQEARATVHQQRRALEQYAQRSLEQRLDQDLRRAATAIAGALRDPMLPAAHLFHSQGGRQRLPRLDSPLPGAETPARQLFSAILENDHPIPKGQEDSPWRQRRALHGAFLRALREGSDRRVESTFRAVLQHRVRYRIAPPLDLPATLALLHVFNSESRPAPELLRALLHDGLEDGMGGEVAPLVRLLLAHRGRFTRPDFLFLGERIVELCEGAGIPFRAFVERSREFTERPVPLPPEVGEPMVIDFGGWFVRRAGADAGGSAVSGIALDLPLLLRRIATEMVDATLLRAGDSIHPATALPQHVALADLALRVDSQRWPRRLADIERRYRLKAALVWFSACLAGALAALAVALQVRRLRLLELRSEFVATVSHELRTPLASVRLLAETVAKRARAADLRDYPARIVQEVDRLHFLVENILSFNRLEKGRMKPQLSSVSLDELLAEVRSETESQTDRPVVFCAPPTGVTLHADPELLRLLFLNLTRNACLYNDRQPVRITIDHRPLDSGGSRILCTDNGRGIPQSEWSKVFAEFYRPRRSRGSGGTGLGLALCRRIAALHHGRLEIAASGREGTTFRLLLPQA